MKKITINFKKDYFSLEFDKYLVELKLNHEGFILDVFDNSEIDNPIILTSMYEFWNNIITEKV